MQKIDIIKKRLKNNRGKNVTLYVQNGMSIGVTGRLSGIKNEEDNFKVRKKNGQESRFSIDEVDHIHVNGNSPSIKLKGNSIKMSINNQSK
jgi:hypothetical protein